MERFYYEVPSIDRKGDAIEYINEHYEYKSNINGVGGLHRYLDNYEGWLEKLEHDYNMLPTEEKVPARTYFLIRESDNKIIGMTNIRLSLNEALKKFGGHIGYSIRPTERRKGYNKINLYLILQIAKSHGLEKVLITCADYNEGSRKTIISFGGIYEKSNYDESDNENMELYWIDINESLEKYKNTYERYVSKNKR